MLPLVSAAVFIGIIFTTNASSSLTDGNSNTSRFVDNLGVPNCTNVMRQLLNQETLMRMFLSKDVHYLMNTVVELKEKQLKTESQVTKLKQENQNSKQENQRLAKDVMKLKKELAIYKKTLLNNNQTFIDIDESILKITENQKLLKDHVQKREKDFENKTSEILNDLKLEWRTTSATILELREKSSEIDKSIPKLIENKFRRLSDNMYKSIEVITYNLTEIQTKQSGLVSEVNAIQDFRTNISKLTSDSISEIKEKMQQTQVAQLQQAVKISALEVFEVNISSRIKSMKTTVGFTAGMTSSSSGWSSGTLVFNKIIYDVGGGYNARTGVFTATEDGHYVFYVTILPYNSYNIYIDIVLNGASKVRTMSYHSGGSQHQTGTNMVLLRLKQGDQVWVKHYSGQGYYGNSAAPYTTFSGFRL